jgi:hypothetical protein
MRIKRHCKDQNSILIKKIISGRERTKIDDEIIKSFTEDIAERRARQRHDTDNEKIPSG